MTSLSLLAALALAAPQDWYARAVKSVEMTVSPATAKPGETVTVAVTITLNDGFHTYPTVQPDPKAKDFVNTVTFPAADAAGLIFVGTVQDPANPIKKAEPLLGIKAMHEFGGVVTYTRKAVVSPKASGTLAVKLPKFVLTVCDESNCFPPKSLTPEATLTVSGAAVDIENALKAEVETALAPKK
jgi:hypothetical protein